MRKKDPPWVPHTFLEMSKMKTSFMYANFSASTCSQGILFCQAHALPTKRALVSRGLASSFRENEICKWKLHLQFCFVKVWSERSLVSRKKRLAIFNIQNDQSFPIHISGERHNAKAVTNARQRINPNSFNSVGEKKSLEGCFFPPLLPLEHLIIRIL